MNSNSIMSSNNPHPHPPTHSVCYEFKQYYVLKQPTPTPTHTLDVLWIQTIYYVCQKPTPTPTQPLDVLWIQTVLCLPTTNTHNHPHALCVKNSNSILAANTDRFIKCAVSVSVSSFSSSTTMWWPCFIVTPTGNRTQSDPVNLWKNMTVIQWISGGTWQRSSESLEEHDSDPVNLWRNMTWIQWIFGGTWQRSSESLEEHDMDPVNLWRNMTVIKWIFGGTWLWFSESLEEHDSGYK